MTPKLCAPSSIVMAARARRSGRLIGRIRVFSLGIASTVSRGE